MIFLGNYAAQSMHYYYNVKFIKRETWTTLCLLSIIIDNHSDFQFLDNLIDYNIQLVDHQILSLELINNTIIESQGLGKISTKPQKPLIYLRPKIIGQ